MCLETSVVQKLTSDSKQKKVLQEIISKKEKDISDLQNQIASKQREIDFIEARDSTLLKAKQDEIKIMESQMQLYDKGLTDLQKALRKANRKTRFVGLMGILVSAGAFFIGSGGLK